MTMTGPASAEGSSTTHILSTSTSSHDVSLSVRSVGSSDEPRGGSGYLRTVVGGSRSSNGKEGSGTDGVSSRSGADDGESASKNAQIGEISAAALGAGASGGYTCGLWFLFHYIAGIRAHSDTIVVTVNVQKNEVGILTCVSYFFAITSCQWSYVYQQSARHSRGCEGEHFCACARFLRMLRLSVSF